MLRPAGRAFVEGMRRVNGAPAVLVGVYLAAVLLALPLAIVVGDAIAASLGASLAAEEAARGVNYGWWLEFQAEARGLTSTFTPSIIGFAAVLGNLGSLAENRGHAWPVAAAGIAYGFFWLFALGGILDRYARSRPTRAAGFFAAAGVFWLRFARLALLAWLVYHVLFRYVHGWLFDGLYPWLTADVTAERTAFAIRLALYAVFGGAVGLAVLIFDYAKIRAVVEDRRSMIGAIVAGARFVWRHKGSTLALYLLDGAVFLLVLAVYRLAAPGAGASVWVAFALGQLFIVARLWTKLLFYASQTVLFQNALAHAAYAAAPEPVWPDSPAAEALARLPR
jgi:hypothetical protein